jgi:GT2 family glycosyltransferase
MYPMSEYRRGGAMGRPRAVEVLSGACLLLRPEALGGEGLFDEDYFVYSEEIDLCDRLKQAGWDLHWVPAARVTHKGGRSTSQVADAMFLELYRNKVKFFRKRRGAVRTWLYKLILLQAAMPRWLLGQAARGLPMRQRAEWQNLARQYRLLLANLARL